MKVKSHQRHFTWMLLLLLLELLPGSSHLLKRQKRQIIFPEYNENRVGTSCVTPDRRPGDCVPLTSCPIVMETNNYDRIRRFFCELRGEVGVCCPLDAVSGTTSTTETTIGGLRPSPVTATRYTPSSEDVRITSTKPAFLPKECGLSKYGRPRVVNGREARKGSWPWMAAIYRERNGVKAHRCGGTLVTSQHVITAAHCVVGRGARTLNPSVLSVRLGEHDIYSTDDDMDPIDVDVSSVTTHENYDPGTYRNDIAVLKLVRPVEFNTNISPICLPYDAFRNTNLSGRTVFLAGWGSLYLGGSSSPVLREASFKVQDQTFCGQTYRDYFPITNVYLCAGTLDGTQDSCEGDSGGPLMIVDSNSNRFYVVGLVSFGIECATPGFPGVYTRVTEFLDWLLPLLRS